MNKKRVRPLYRLDGLHVRMRVQRRKHIALHAARRRRQRGQRSAGAWASCTTRWPMAGRFACSRVVDQWSRQSPILEVASRLSGVTLGQPSARSRAANGPWPDRSPSIMAPSSCHGPSRTGPFTAACNSPSSGPGNPWEEPSLSLLTGASAWAGFLIAMGLWARSVWSLLYGSERR